MVCFCIQWVQLWWEVIVCFVDIGDRHCLKRSFHNYMQQFFVELWPTPTIATNRKTR
jgi:hypothetical protein